MGILLNEICCIDPSNITESYYENTNPTQLDTYNRREQFRNMRRRKSINQFKNSSLDSFPLNEIGPSFNINDKPIKEVDSLSLVPISTKNVILQQNCNPLDYYDNLKKMGKGTFGTVYKVMHKQSGAIRAMKVISKKKLKYGYTDEDIIQEINILTKLEHPHIIKIYEFYNYNKHFYIINEFCNEGDLSDKLIKIKRFPEFFVKIIMVQIFNAVLYLHKKCVFHGDLKLENIMIDSFLHDDEQIPTKKDEDNFISSLLADEKEIGEYLKENNLRRSHTIKPKSNRNFNFGVRPSFNLKGSTEKNLILNNKTKLSKSALMKVKTITNKKFFKKQSFAEEEEKNYIKKGDTAPVLKEKKIKNPFAYLNGEVDDEEEEEEDKESKFKKKDSLDKIFDKVDKDLNIKNIKLFKNKNEPKQTDDENIFNKKKQYLETINEDDDINLPIDDSNLKKAMFN